MFYFLAAELPEFLAHFLRRAGCGCLVFGSRRRRTLGKGEVRFRPCQCVSFQALALLRRPLCDPLRGGGMGRMFEKGESLSEQMN